MGLVTATWRFDEQPPPDGMRLRAALADATGLHVVHDAAGMPDNECHIAFARLAEIHILRSPTEKTLTVSGGIPPHPYVWAHLEGAMQRLGGAPIGWRSDPIEAALQGPWADLSRRDRWLLGRPMLFGLLKFDRFLQATRGAKPPSGNPA